MSSCLEKCLFCKENRSQRKCIQVHKESECLCQNVNVTPAGRGGSRAALTGTPGQQG